MNTLGKVQDTQERAVTPEEVAEKLARLQMEKASCIRNCLEIGTGWGEQESWKKAQYFSEEQKQELLWKLHGILLAL